MCDRRSGLVVHVAVAKGGNPTVVMSVYSELRHTEIEGISQYKMAAACAFTNFKQFLLENLLIVSQNKSW